MVYIMSELLKKKVDLLGKLLWSYYIPSLTLYNVRQKRSTISAYSLEFF